MAGSDPRREKRDAVHLSVHPGSEPTRNGMLASVSSARGVIRPFRSIARALIKRPRVLIFDEATSNLDPATVEAFAATVNKLKGRATILFIAHILPQALKVDEVIRFGGNPAAGARVAPVAAVPASTAVTPISP